MDSTVGKIAIPLAAGGISAYSPRYGASGVQGALGAWRSMNEASLDQQKMAVLKQQEDLKMTQQKRIQDFFAGMQPQASGHSAYGGGGASGNEPADDMGIKANAFDLTGRVPQPTYKPDPQTASALSLLAAIDPEAATRKYADMAASYKPPEAQKPERHYTEFVNPDNQKVTNVLTFRPDGGTNETSYIAGDMAKPDKAEAEPSLDRISYQEFKAKNPNATVMQWRAANAAAVREPKEPKDSVQLTPQVQRRLDAISARFGQEQAVKDAQTLGQAVSFMESLSNDRATPADDQAAIYAFAKAMDPNSAVREGEYRNVQDYSQALLQAFGLKAKRVFTNSGLLTPEARSFLKQTIRSKYASVRKQYDALEQSYRDRLENAKAGGVDLVDYGSSLPSITPPAPGADPKGRPPLSSFMLKQ